MQCSGAARLTRTLLLSVSFTALAAAQVHAQELASADMEEIVVRGIALSLQLGIEAKRDSDAIQDGLSADDLGRLPNKNSSEAIARLPGVNISQDQGEGRYVSIRGASPNLNAITVNGLAVGSVESGSRRIPLDILGGELLGGIDVVKAVTPDMEANAVGGYINVKTASPFDKKSDFFGRATVQFGDAEYDSRNPTALSGSVGGKFGSAENFGVILGASFADREYFTKGLYADDWREVPGIARGAPQSHKFNNYFLDRERTGFTGTAEYRPSEGNIYYLRGIWTETDETEARFRSRNYFLRVTTPAAVTLNPDQASGTYSNMRLRTELRDQSTLRRIANASIGGENKFDKLKIEYQAALVDNKLNQPTRSWTFQSPDIFSGTFSMAPEYFQVTPNVPQIVANANRIGINAYSASKAYATDKGYQLKFDARYDFDTATMKGFFKAGAQFRSVRKFQDLTSDNYGVGTGGVAAFNVASPGVWTGDLLQGKVKGSFYQVGPRINLAGTRLFTDNNINNTVVLRRDAAGSLASSTTGDFRTRENILAAYVMGSATWNDWTVLGGGRMENTKVKGDSFDLIGTTTVLPVTRSGEYTHFLPAVHVRYNPNQGPYMFRAAWTNTIGRPDFTDITANRVITQVPISPGVIEGSISQGNPDLKAYKSHNFDLSAEYYFPNGGILSAAGFYKEVNGFIARQQITENNVTVDGTLYSVLTTSTPINAQKGKIKGAEFNYQQKLAFLPAPFDGFGLGTSLTVVDSSIRVPNRTDTLPFIGQADMVYSLIGYYQKGPVEIVATYAWADNILVTVGGNKDGDLYDNDYGRFDVRAGYRLTEHVNLFLELQNINNEPLGEFQGRETWVTRQEVYGRTAYIGITVNW